MSDEETYFIGSADKFSQKNGFTGGDENNVHNDRQILERTKIE